MVVGDTDDFLRGLPVSMSNLYKEDYRTHDEYQYRIKDKVCGSMDLLLPQVGCDVDVIRIAAPQELLDAAKNNEMKRARLMIDDQANASVADMGGFSALYFAALNGHVDMCRLLMRHGATFPEKDSEKGIQLKGYCTFYGHKEALELLEASWRA